MKVWAELNVGGAGTCGFNHSKRLNNRLQNVKFKFKMVMIKKSTTLYDVAPYSLVETYTRRHGIIHYTEVCFRYTKVSNATKTEWQRIMAQWISDRFNTPKTQGFTFSPITQDRGCCNLRFPWMHALPYGAQRPVLSISDEFYNFKITCDYYVCWEAYWMRWNLLLNGEYSQSNGP